MFVNQFLTLDSTNDPGHQADNRQAIPVNFAPLASTAGGVFCFRAVSGVERENDLEHFVAAPLQPAA